ncbi:hypothetical protein HPP92_018210 [Vanilla planifolia]|uniref:MADS-box domain-containing protein n=1 Tax=Vanilla planifolia TaxID=51239 RepID=A0A835UN53_VANPL|nr:hypothetical protein HPP92_018210 [Vanilla planifolia]
MVGKGRRKIEMKLIESKAARTVCLSKRRNGLFKKAKELSILCGAKVGVVAFSLSGKPKVFNAPFLDSFLDPQNQVCSDLPPLQEVSDDWESAFCKAMAGKATPCWWKNVDLQSMGMEELLRFENALAAYREKRMKEEMMGFDASQAEQMVCGEELEEEMMGFDASQAEQMACGEELEEEMMGFDASQAEQMPCGEELEEEMMGFDASQAEQMACGEEREEEMMDFCGLQMMQQSPIGIEEEMLNFYGLQMMQQSPTGIEEEMMNFYGLQMMQQSPIGIDLPSLPPIETDLDPSLLEQLLLQYT